MNRAALLTAALAVTLTNPAADAAAQATGSFDWATYSGPEGTRRYKLFVPASRDAAKPAPLVVMLHGCTQDPDDFARGSRFNEAAAEHGVIVAWPEQPAANQPMKCWSWYDPAHQARGAGEPAIIAAITREVMTRHGVDPARVYVGGVSAGGAMAVNTAASYPELFAAVGVHSAIAYRSAGSVAEALGVMKTGAVAADSLAATARAALGERTMPAIVIHGAADAVVAPVNGRQLASQLAVAAGAKDALVDERTVGGRRAEVWRYGQNHELWIVDGLGHAWSGGSPDGTFTDPQGPDATREILRFLLAHPKP
jgi:poly(hydroxyalkanoate) depolymerase family esterase